MDDPHPSTSNSRPYTIGVFIASTVIAIFIIFHFFRIIWKRLMKTLVTSNEIQLEPSTLTVKTREDARKLSSSCLKKIHNEMLKELKVDDVNCVQFDVEKCDKIQSRFDERRLRTQSHRFKGDRIHNEREREFGQTMRHTRNKNEDMTFFAGRSHQYIQDV